MVTAVGRTWDLVTTLFAECSVLQAVTRWARLGSNQQAPRNRYYDIRRLCPRFAGNYLFGLLGHVLLSLTRFDRAVGRVRDLAVRYLPTRDSHGCVGITQPPFPDSWLSMRVADYAGASAC